MLNHIPELNPHEGSWIVIERATGEAVGEIFKGGPLASQLDKLNFAKYELKGIHEYLGSL